MFSYKEFALKNKLILTCGSDFHVKTKHSISIGGTDCEKNEEVIILGLKEFIKL